MKTYNRKDYKIKSYSNEKFSLEIYDENLNSSYTEYSSNYETLYTKAKEEAKKGRKCSLYELKYEVTP